MLRPTGGLDEEATVFQLRDAARDGAAVFFRTGKIPKVREVAALLRFHGLHRAFLAIEEKALAVGLFLQGKPTSVLAQPGKLLDEVVFAQDFERGDLGDFRLRQSHLPWPAAAGRAALAFVKNRHPEMLLWRAPPDH